MTADDPRAALLAAAARGEVVLSHFFDRDGVLYAHVVVFTAGRSDWLDAMVGWEGLGRELGLTEPKLADKTLRVTHAWPLTGVLRLEQKEPSCSDDAKSAESD